MTLKQGIIDVAIQAGADLVGFGNVERFETENGNVVKKIFPGCKTVIGIGMRVLRGSLRGVEEGTNYFQFHMAGLETLEFKILPEKARRVCAFLEDEGYDALAQIRNRKIRQDDVYTHDIYYQEVTRNCRPEHQMDFVHSAVLCGMGELGMSGHVLTDAYGPLVKFCFVLTDAEIDPDSIVERHICDSCGECRRQCHSDYALREETKDVELGGVHYNVFDYNECICNAYFHGANRSKNPWMRPGIFNNLEDGQEIRVGKKDLTQEEVLQVLQTMDKMYTSVDEGLIEDIHDAVENKKVGAGGMNSKSKPVISGQIARTICGNACDRACYVHLEEKGLMDVKYVNRFRTRPDWHLDPEGD